MAMQAKAAAALARRPSFTVASPSALRFPQVHCVPQVNVQHHPVIAATSWFVALLSSIALAWDIEPWKMGRNMVA